MKDRLLESTNQNLLHNFVATCSQATMVVVMVVAMVVVIMGVVMFPIIMVVVIVMLPLAMLNPESFPWFKDVQRSSDTDRLGRKLTLGPHKSIESIS